MGSTSFTNRFTPGPNKIQSACKSCGRSMFFPRSISGRYKTCGGECAKKLADEIKAAARQEKWRCCAKCGVSFLPKKSQLDAGHGKWCSNACYTSRNGTFDKSTHAFCPSCKTVKPLTAFYNRANPGKGGRYCVACFLVSPQYLASLVGVSAEHMRGDLLEAKRLQMCAKRLSRNIKKGLRDETRKDSD